MYAFDATTGRTLWVSDDVGAFNSDSTLVANGVVYSCSAKNGSVYALDATSGKTLWISPPADGQIFTMPAVANGMVFLASGSQGGPVYAFRLPA
ncbi:MAG: PQQ-binding-like beta-propeller repeat protein [Ktedonobacteraceae bacterium]|nr:PQQ-binding-like beta-propeller repeat protein [Ktedonobacteraceae bacterium]